MIQLLLVDDQQLVRAGICSLLALSDKVSVIAQAKNGQEAVEYLSKHRVDCVLMDIQMPILDGIQALESLYQKRITTPVIMLTTFDDKALVQQAVGAGAKGYLLKDASLEQLVLAIEQVVEGNTLIHPTATDTIRHRLQSVNVNAVSATDDALQESLTEKEKQVLRLMAAGYSNQEIADTLFRSTGTIKNQVSTILDKLGVRDRTQAVIRSIALSII